jgi:hypothetical protein
LRDASWMVIPMDTTVRLGARSKSSGVPGAAPAGGTPGAVTLRGQALPSTSFAQLTAVAPGSSP